LEEKHEILLIVSMKMYKKVQEGLTTTGVLEFHRLADLPLNKMKARILDGREVKDAVTKLTLGECNTLVSQVQSSRGEIFDTVDRVWDVMERYLMNMSLMTMQLKGLVVPVNNRCLVDMSVGLVGDDVNYSCFVVVKELGRNFVRKKGIRLLKGGCGEGGRVRHGDSKLCSVSRKRRMSSKT